MTLSLYFAGGGTKEVSDYMDNMKCDRLYSQLLDRKAIARQIEAIKNNNSGKLFIDSGAYTAHTKGTKIDVDEYINYLNGIHEYCTVYAQVDYIAGRFGQPKDPKEVEAAPGISWENYNYMRARLIDYDKLIPVFHQGEDFKLLINMLETTYGGEHIPYIGISCSKDLAWTEWVKWFDEVFDVIMRSSNPKVMTHAFGMTSLKYLKMYPFTSADSTSWLKFAAFGTVLTKPWGGVRISDRNSADPDHAMNLEDLDRKVVEDYFKQEGFDFKDICENTYSRTMCNAKFYKDFVDNYKYERTAPFKLASFKF